MPGKKPICASQANNMALKTVLVLALASGAAAADKICMADETNTRDRRAAVSSLVHGLTRSPAGSTSS